MNNIPNIKILWRGAKPPIPESHFHTLLHHLYSYAHHKHPAAPGFFMCLNTSILPADLPVLVTSPPDLFSIRIVPLNSITFAELLQAAQFELTVLSNNIQFYEI